MIFRASEPLFDSCGDYHNWLVSENNQWCIVDRLVLFGARVAVFHVDGYGPTFDYCCADDPHLLSLVKVAVWRIMSELPETVTAKELLKEFPGYLTKPVNRCPECLPKLFKRAEMEWALRCVPWNPDPFAREDNKISWA